MNQVTLYRWTNWPWTGGLTDLVLMDHWLCVDGTTHPVDSSTALSHFYICIYSYSFLSDVLMVKCSILWFWLIIVLHKNYWWRITDYYCIVGLNDIVGMDQMICCGWTNWPCKLLAVCPVAAAAVQLSLPAWSPDPSCPESPPLVCDKTQLPSATCALPELTMTQFKCAYCSHNTQTLAC